MLLPNVDRSDELPVVRYEFCWPMFDSPGNRGSRLLSRSGSLVNRWNQ